VTAFTPPCDSGHKSAKQKGLTPHRACISKQNRRDQIHIHPEFTFSKLAFPATAAAGSQVSVSFDVTNTGRVAGAEVAELYVSDPSAKAKRPERELKGFEKVRLAPGESKHVTLTLDARAFSYWDEAAHKWTIDPGKFVILVGDSSENTPLHADITLN
jgi:beta-glucosidase